MCDINCKIVRNMKNIVEFELNNDKIMLIRFLFNYRIIITTVK